MRLIDADRLKEVFRRNTGHDYSEFIDIQPTVDVLEQIRAEIQHLADLELLNMKLVLQIIDKYRESEK